MYNCLSRLGKNKEWRFLKRLPFRLFLLFWFDACQSQYQCFIVTQSKFGCGLHFFPLYLFGYHLKFVLLVKWESTRGRGAEGGHGASPHPPLNCREKKNRRERQKEKISNKKP